jgi:hypothetical protein
MDRFHALNMIATVLTVALKYDLSDKQQLSLKLLSKIKIKVCPYVDTTS